MKVIIAEKPSVAREIATIVGANEKKEGYLSGNGYAVTWAFGHLIQLAMPEEYGITGFQSENLPILPNPFILKPRQVKDGKEYKTDPGAKKQLDIIKNLFDKAERIIVSTDAAREGELIFRYIYNYLNCTKPFDRLWISSLTDKAIREGLQNLRPGNEYDNLYQSAKARSEADWLVGVNSSRALSIAAGRGVFSLGRVQTPTLAMVCSRYLENKNFTPVPYWELQMDTMQDGTAFSVRTKDRIESQTAAKDLFESQKQQTTIVVQSLETKEAIQEPPLLYDLTTLQKEANSKYGFSADKTLSIAQKLYEKKYLSYPRTGSRYISDDVYSEIPGLIAKLAEHPAFGSYAKTLCTETLNTRSVDSKKVTDHHALLITENIPTNLDKDEQLIYDMTAGRMLEAFSGKCIKDRTVILLNCADVLYTAKGAVTKVPGWREVFNGAEEDKDENKELPTISVGQELAVKGVQLLEKQTKAKPIHTESTLLGAMETAGKELESEEQRLALKSCGIGTPATHAAIIETLFSRGYMQREKKVLIPTEKGLAVYDAVKDKRIADVEMTGMWEDTFVKIESGEADADNFKKGMEIYATQITAELLLIQMDIKNDRPGAICPRCSDKILFYTKVAKCNNKTCDLTLFRGIASKELNDTQLNDLLSKGKTATIKGFKSKAGKSFDAAVSLDEDYKVKFVFDNKEKPKKKK